ncbi:MAG: HAMP domain-containing sensor histidine kinase [Myxococcota bacterium]|nr:HAMP domain-containing sensor histidine kinase [Myxococcota bacterium]
MRRTTKTARLRRQASYWAFSLALLTIAIFAIQRTLMLRQEMADEDARQTKRTMRAVMDFWEKETFRQADVWIRELAQTSDIPAAERRTRKNVTWFDAYYIWTPGGGGGRMEYPARTPVEDPARLMYYPCLVQADRIARHARRIVAAEAFRACRDSPPIFHLYASSRAASLLLQEGRPADAWSALNEVAVPLFLPLHEAAAQGLSPERMVVRRIQGSQAQAGLGQPDRQREILLATAREIADMDAPQLEELLSFTQYTIPGELRRSGQTSGLSSLAPWLERAERRMAAYEEVTQRLITRPPTDTLQIASDPYGDNRFLLLYGPVAGGRMMAAIQVDPETLLDKLAEVTGEPDWVILDAEGDPIDPNSSVTAADIWVKEPFGKLFPHLRAGRLHGEPLTRKARLIWAVSQIAPIILVLILGWLAIASRVRAEHRREELYQRQQDFIARVTHELKTPLAGIRLMAETLEMGAVEDPDQRATFLGRILHEADRLGARIDEVLRVARQSTPPQKRPLSPRKLAEQIAEEWTIRFTEASAELTLDLTDVAELEADEELLVDALNNLLSNALKYRCEDRAHRCILRLYTEGTETVFEVIDNGLGVPTGMRKTIFERFARVEGDGRGKAGGHGLGLSFVAETATAHGGSIECSEGIDGGARFTLRLRG